MTAAHPTGLQTSVATISSKFRVAQFRLQQFRRFLQFMNLVFNLSPNPLPVTGYKALKGLTESASPGGCARVYGCTEGQAEKVVCGPRVLRWDF